MVLREKTEHPVPHRAGGEPPAPAGNHGEARTRIFSSALARTSSRPASARLIHSVTRSSLSSDGRYAASAITALNERPSPFHGAWTALAVARSFSASSLALPEFVSGRMKARDQAVYFTARSVWRTALRRERANCSMYFSKAASP